MPSLPNTHFRPIAQPGFMQLGQNLIDLAVQKRRTDIQQQQADTQQKRAEDIGEYYDDQIRLREEAAQRERENAEYLQEEVEVPESYRQQVPGTPKTMSRGRLKEFEKTYMGEAIEDSFEEKEKTYTTKIDGQEVELSASGYRQWKQFQKREERLNRQVQSERVPNRKAAEYALRSIKDLKDRINNIQNATKYNQAGQDKAALQSQLERLQSSLNTTLRGMSDEDIAVLEKRYPTVMGVSEGRGASEYQPGNGGAPAQSPTSPGTTDQYELIPEGF